MSTHPGEPINFGAIAASILRNHGRFPWEWMGRLSMRMAYVLSRDPKEDKPAPGYRRVTAAEAARVRAERRDRAKADPWGVNGYQHG